ncbi:hypothetical protein BV25DRAFT_852125 [Artomyces pyxidatus]|uniref:Uncharacterized protein n=1 Tax=Artomyces pyxidatus TaxID=48021 RepID=A0ACB8TH04_9AGAM|nr:hypothetical protein BV25DRAFT_852125 [Artomyces pyxidatus]
MEAGSIVPHSPTPSVTGLLPEVTRPASVYSNSPMIDRVSLDRVPSLDVALDFSVPRPLPMAAKPSSGGFRLWRTHGIAFPELPFGRRRSSTHGEPPTEALIAYESAMEAYKLDLIDEFFGGRRMARRPILPCPEVLGRFHDLESGNEKLERKEPNTLARKLFYLGFAFFPLWFWGISLFNNPTTAPIEEKPTGTTRCRFCLEPTLRDIEMKWMRRCLVALFTFICLAAITLVIVEAAFYEPRKNSPS